MVFSKTFILGRFSHREKIPIAAEDENDSHNFITLLSMKLFGQLSRFTAPLIVAFIFTAEMNAQRQVASEMGLR
jgi:hypothetical protein